MDKTCFKKANSFREAATDILANNLNLRFQVLLGFLRHNVGIMSLPPTSRRRYTRRHIVLEYQCRLTRQGAGHPKQNRFKLIHGLEIYLFRSFLLGQQAKYEVDQTYPDHKTAPKVILAPAPSHSDKEEVDLKFERPCKIEQRLDLSSVNTTDFNHNTSRAPVCKG